MLAHQAALPLKALSTSASAAGASAAWRGGEEAGARANPFHALPNAVVVRILAALDAAALRATALVEKRLNELHLDSTLWQRLHEARFGHHGHSHADIAAIPKISWKEVYRECLHAEVLGLSSWRYIKQKLSEEEHLNRNPLTRLIPLSSPPPLPEDPFKCDYAPISSSFLLLGAPAAGKTSLINALQRLPFNPSEESTIGAREVKFWRFKEGKLFRFHVWDCAGSERYARLNAKLISFAQFVVLVYNAAQPESLESVKSWKNEVIKEAGNKPILVVATQADRPKPVAPECSTTAPPPEDDPQPDVAGEKLDDPPTEEGPCLDPKDPFFVVKRWARSVGATWGGEIASSSRAGVEAFADTLCSFVLERTLFD